MWRKLLCVLVCAVCALCLGAQVQEPTKGDQEPTKGDGRLFLGSPYWEYWNVKEVRHWTSTDGYKENETVYYTLEVAVDATGVATDFTAYDDSMVVIWAAQPPVPRVWNDFSAKKPCATFSNCALIGLLKLNTKWLKATGTLTQSVSDGVWPNLSWYSEGNVNATYQYTNP
jgi:hypothetical protein